MDLRIFGLMLVFSLCAHMGCAATSDYEDDLGIGQAQGKSVSLKLVTYNAFLRTQFLEEVTPETSEKFRQGLESILQKIPPLPPGVNRQVKETLKNLSIPSIPKSNPVCRAEQIGQHLNDANYDVVALQETWDEQLTQLLAGHAPTLPNRFLARPISPFPDANEVLQTAVRSNDPIQSLLGNLTTLFTLAGDPDLRTLGPCISGQGSYQTFYGHPVNASTCGRDVLGRPTPKVEYVTSRLTNGGLSVLSRRDIKLMDVLPHIDASCNENPTFGSKTWPFCEAIGDDAIANKGVMYTPIKKEGADIHLFNLHMNLGTLGGDYGGIKENQLKALRSIIERTVCDNPDAEKRRWPVIVVGDFNVDSTQPGQPGDQDFENMVRLLDSTCHALPREAYREHIKESGAVATTDHNCRGSTLNDCSPFDTPMQRMDYVFILDPEKPLWNVSVGQAQLLETFTGCVSEVNPLGHLSDHKPLEVSLKFTRP